MPEVPKDPTLDRAGELLAQFDKWDQRIATHWGAWRKEALELYAMVAGTDHWTAEDKALLEDTGRLAPVFNEMGPIIDAVSGAEIMDRQQVKYYPREVGDSGVNELYTKAADWVRDRCDADQEETESFRDTFICGMGWSGTRMDYDEDPDGQVMVERTDPLEMALDPSSRKANGSDARYIRRVKFLSEEAFEEAFPGATGDMHGPKGGKLAVNEPSEAYEGDGVADDEPAEGERAVREYQWYENRPVVVVQDPEDGETVDLQPEEFAKLQAEALKLGVELEHVRQSRRVYYRAYVADGEILNLDPETGDAEVMEEGEFTYKLITGKRDRNKGIWYGLARPMKDPQRWANQFMSQLLAILAASTKGGNVLETDAVEDIKQFEGSWAAPGGNTYVRPGGLDKIRQKPQTPYPAGLERLIGTAQEAIRKTTGVNPEMLGLVDREQAGVLEHQRKQAAYGILAAFFDSFRRYRRQHGRLLLKFFKYLPDGYLVRIVGDDGLAKYVPLTKLDDTAKFDVIVDEAPAGPNQKAATFGVLMQLMPMLKDADLPAEFWSEVAKYMPLPDSLTQAMSKAILASGQEEGPDPVQQAAMQAELAAKTASAQKDAAGAEKDLAEAAQTRAETGVVFPPDQQSFGETQL